MTATVPPYTLGYSAAADIEARELYRKLGFAEAEAAIRRDDGVLVEPRLSFPTGVPVRHVGKVVNYYNGWWWEEAGPKFKVHIATLVAPAIILDFHALVIEPLEPTEGVSLLYLAVGLYFGTKQDMQPSWLASSLYPVAVHDRPWASVVLKFDERYYEWYENRGNLLTARPYYPVTAGLTRGIPDGVPPGAGPTWNPGQQGRFYVQMSYVDSATGDEPLSFEDVGGKVLLSPTSPEMT